MRMNQLGLCGWEDLMEEVALCDRTRGPLSREDVCRSMTMWENLVHSGEDSAACCM